MVPPDRAWVGAGSSGWSFAVPCVSSQQESDVVPDQVTEEPGLVVLQVLRVANVRAVANPPASGRREVPVQLHDPPKDLFEGVALVESTKILHNLDKVLPVNAA